MTFTVPDFICHYLCGTCGQAFFGAWWMHQQHYENHRKEES